MKRQFVVALSAAMVLIVAAAGAVAIANPAAATVARPEGWAGQTISTVGEGVVFATTTKARLVLAVDAQGVSLTSSHAAATVRVDAVRSALKAQGIADQDVNILHYYAGSRFAPNEPPPPGHVAHHTTYVLEAVTNSPAKLGDLLGAAAEAGMTRVDHIQFLPGDGESQFAAARSAALKDAQEKAKQVAAEAGLKVAHPLQIEELDVHSISTKPGNVASGQNRITAALRVSWAVEE